MMRYTSPPLNSASLVEKIEEAMASEEPAVFEGEELEALHERLIKFLPDWGGEEEQDG